MKVLIGVSGSIAAFKSLILSRLLFKRGHRIKVILTRGALHFVTPLSFKELAGAEVFTEEDFFKGNTHIDLARWADLFLIAPATYNVIGKVAVGIADDLLTSTAAAYLGPIHFAPAMHTEMWRNPILRKNIETLKTFGHVVLPVGSGDLASGDVGEGRMLEPEEIVSYVEDVRKLREFWGGKRVVITYGGTREPIDDVRVITNLSSGKMGIALASAFTSAGAHVVAVACGGVEAAPSREFYRVNTVEELHDLLKGMDYDYLFMAAAVSDYRPEYRKGKIKKGEDSLILPLVKTRDILSSISGDRRGIIVGFALEEPDKLHSEARRKLRAKGIDYVVANPTGVIGSDRTTVFLYGREGLIGEFSGTKWEVARQIVKALASV